VVGAAPSCALLGGFAIGAPVALLWQHNANPSYKCEREMLASALYSLCTPSFSLCGHLFTLSLARDISIRLPNLKCVTLLVPKIGKATQKLTE